MEKLEILVHILIIITMVLIIILILYWLANQMWIISLLKNKCIAECNEINKLNPYTCVC